jgi:hypothetical protein
MSTAPKQESTSAQARIRNLLEQERISEARGVIEEALASHPEDEELHLLRRVLAPAAVRRTGALDADRTREFQWLAQNGAKHRGFWVAIHKGGLVAGAKSLNELLERVRALALTRAPLIHFVD